MTSSTTYPFGAAYQRKLAAALFRDRSFLPAYRAAIAPHHFDDPALRDFSAGLLRYFDRHHTTPTTDAVVEIAGELAAANQDGGDPLIDTVRALFDEDLTDIGDVRDRAVQFATTQACLGATSRALEIIEEQGDLDEIPNLFTKALSVGKRQDSLGLVYLQDFSRFQTSFNDQAYPSGLPTMDRWLGGGFCPGELVVIAAGTGTGKSWAKVNFAKAALLWGAWGPGVTPHGRGPKTVVWITLEMPEARVAARFDQVLFLRERTTATGEFERLISEMVGRARNNLIIKRMPGYKASTQDVRSYLTRLESEGLIKPGNLDAGQPGNFLLIIDYPKLLRPPRAYKGEGGHREIQETYLDCRNIGEEWAVPVIGGIQITRDAFEKPHVSPKDFAGAFDVAADADHILASCQTPQEKRKEPAEKRLLVCKSRNGEDGRELCVTYDKDCQAWTEKGECFGEEEKKDALKEKVAAGAREKEARKAAQGRSLV